MEMKPIHKDADKKAFKSLTVSVKNIEVKEEDGQQYGYIEGYASTFGNIDHARDMMMKGCFEESLKDKTNIVQMLYQHQNSKVIGGYPVLKEDDHGLYFKGRILLGLQLGSEAHLLLKEGLINSVSIGYMLQDYKRVEVDGEDTYWEINKVKLVEISLVNTPCNPEALITAVKSLSDEDRAKVSKSLAVKSEVNRYGKIKSIKELEGQLKSDGLSNQEALTAISLIKSLPSDSGESRQCDIDENEMKLFVDSLKSIKDNLNKK